MNDQTKKLTTPSGKEVELKSYITARELNVIRKLISKDTEVDPVTGNQSQKITGGIIQDTQEKLIEILVVSFDGSTEKIIDRLLDGTPQDYDFISNDCFKIFKENLTPAK